MSPSKRPRRSSLWIVCSLGCFVALVGGGIATGQWVPTTILAGFAGGWLLLAAHVFYGQEQPS